MIWLNLIPVSIKNKNTKNNKNSKNTSRTSKPASRSPKASAVVSSAKNSLMNRFSSGLKNPFSAEAQGMRVPDLFSFPTATYHLHGTVVLGGVNSLTGGSVMFLPNPLLSCVDTKMIASASTYVATDGCINTTSMGKYANNLPYFGAAIGTSTTNNLSSTLSTYRVVSWGIKISNLLPELSATGRLIVAIAPVGDEIPGLNNLANRTLSNKHGVACITGMSADTHNSSNILNLPSGFELTFGDLTHGDLEIAGTYVSPSYFNFRNSTDTTGYSATYDVGDDLLVNSVGVIGSTSNKDPLRMSGGCAILLYWEGVPSTAPCLQVEYIYHLEGNPNLTTTPAAPIASSSLSSLVGNTSIVESALATVAGTKAFQWISKGADFLNKASKNPLVGALATLAM